MRGKGQKNMLRDVLELVRPAFVQTAALCQREGSVGREVLLVKTLTRGNWIIPKGWPIKGKTLSEAAAIEAWEEAGVEGRIDPKPVGAFTYTKLKKSGLPVQCRPLVYLLQVDTILSDYPEAHKRTRRWFSLPDAADAVQNPELKALLQQI